MVKTDRAVEILERIQFLSLAEFFNEVYEEWRTLPLGVDRHGRLYWSLYYSSLVLVEDPKHQKWAVLEDMGAVKRLVSALDERHIDEFRLRNLDFKSKVCFPIDFCS